MENLSIRFFCHEPGLATLRQSQASLNKKHCPWWIYVERLPKFSCDPGIQISEIKIWRSFETNFMPRLILSSVTDLRKAIVKSRLAECAAAIAANLDKLDRSDSLDSILSESLLDPPQSLQKIPPKRYQSPSRCGSPSLEAPDHLLFGSKLWIVNKLGRVKI